MENIKDINKESQLQALKLQLENSGIDLSKWGTGEAKTLEHLHSEIENGESTLTTDKKGRLLRNLISVGADVYYLDPEGKQLRLREEKQIFKDGRERIRELGQAVSEKIKPDEDPRMAVIRGLQEELGIEGEMSADETGVEEERETSSSYPDLQTHYTNHKFKVILNKEQFRPEGYIEEQDDKTTYFIWEEIKNS